MAGPWGSKVFLLVVLCVVVTSAQDCVVKYEGLDVNFEFITSLNPVDDIAKANTVVDTFEVDNVTAVANSVTEDIYFEPNLVTPVLNIIVTAAFESFENNSRTQTPINFNNNFDPTFKNFNYPEVDSTSYLYVLPMPFPQGISISDVYNNIFVHDLDSSTTNIDVKLDDEGSQYFSVQSTQISEDTEKKQYSVDIIAINQLYFNQPLEFEIIATGEGSGENLANTVNKNVYILCTAELDEGGGTGAPITTTATIRIEMDSENSENDCKEVIVRFDNQVYFTTEAIDDNTLPKTLETTEIIKLSEAADNVTLDITIKEPGEGEPEFDPSHFVATYDKNTKEVTLELISPLTPGEASNDVLLLKLEATDPINELFKAETIVYVDIRPITGNFEFEFYVTTIVDPKLPPGTPLATEPDVIKIPTPPTQNIITTVKKPYDDADWVEDQFEASYNTDNTVTLTLSQSLTPSALAFKSLSLLIEATEETTSFKAQTLVQVNLPTSPWFQNTLYTAIITNPELPPSTVLETEPSPIQLSNCPTEAEVTVVQQDDLFYEDGLFGADIESASGIVTLQLLKDLTPEALANEVLVFQLKASYGEFNNQTSSTIIQVDMPSVDKMDETFTQTIYRGSLDPKTQNEENEEIITTIPIEFSSTLTGSVIMTVINAAGFESATYSDNYGASYDSEANKVTVTLLTQLTSEELEEEVHVMTLKAEVDATYIIETLLYIDIVSSVAAPPGCSGEFSSAIYVSEVSDPKTPQVLETNEDIIIIDYPSDVILELTEAEPGTPSHPELFSVSAPDANGIIVLSLVQPIPDGTLLSTTYLVMLLKASSVTDPTYLPESVIHVQLPDIPCPPPGNIHFDKDLYEETVTVDYTGQVFTVQATHVSNTGTFTYALDFGDNSVYLNGKVEINPTSGEVTVTEILTPGKHEFQVIATHSEGESDNAPAVINVQTIGICDNTVYFPYAVITKTVDEGKDTAILSDNEPPIGFDTCTYSKTVTPSSADSWFTLSESTGSLSITSDSDVEDTMFSTVDKAEILVKLAITCTPQSRVPDQEISVTREEMMVVVTLNDVNDNDPTFDMSEFAVAYPDSNLAHQLLPGAIANIMAKDADKIDTLTYSLPEGTTKYTVQNTTGSLYPVDGLYDYINENVTVVASDPDNKTTQITYLVRHVTYNEVAVVIIQERVLEDVETIITYLNEKSSNYTWGYLRSAVLAEPITLTHISPTLKTKMRRLSVKAGNTGGLLLVLYAIDSNLLPVEYAKLLILLEEIEKPEDWVINGIESWEETTPPPAESVSPGYRTATIVLGILTGLLLIALIFFLYIVYIRKKQKRNIMKEYKNTRSFLNERQLENGKSSIGRTTSVEKEKDSISENDESNENENSAQTHENDSNVLEDNLQVLEVEEERRKSMVTFSDEPEVIPGDSVRL